jgi:tRNA A-37 threonylcarbamoyl transferase component Bud32/tetratricopeptide (TPR) repeat protein
VTEHSHDEIRRLFDLVLDTRPAERDSVLGRECDGDDRLRARVRAMIAAAEGDQFLTQPTAGDMAGGEGAIETLAASPREQVGEQIGRYKLLEQIGEGGFGVVWAAEQREPVKRRVALKIIKLGMDTKQVIARFEAERQALAMMDHPNIAKVLDAGATETGRPFFAMELVKGVPILDYCDTAKLDTKARLDLFTKVCRAIQHAHQKGIIHRDIKPSNVLVTLHDGVPVPKVIDFGIAKATNQELTSRTIYTEHRQMIGTPAYMSPAQAEMSGLDIDTRSDIYSLGVLLYELLTGTTPFESQSLMEAGFAEMMRIIREETPHKPSTRLSSLGETGTRTAEQRRVDVQKLSTILRGDLDWIVMKCLEKDRTRRYETANGLAADIGRHLSDEPVMAGPPSAGYKIRKFVRRNRAGVLAGATIAAVLLLGVVGTSTGLVWALNEQKRAAAEYERATLATAAHTEARAGVHLARGRYALAEPLYLDTLEVRRHALGADHQYTLGVITNLGLLYNLMERHEDAVAMFETSLPIKRRVLGSGHPWTGKAMTGLATAYLNLGRRDDALPLFREAVELRVASADAPDADAKTINRAAWMLLAAEFEELRDPARAIGLAERACAAAEAADGVDLWFCLDTLALAQHQTGDNTAAVTTQRRAISLMPEGSENKKLGIELAPDNAGLKATLEKYEAALAGETEDTLAEDDR